MVNKAEDDDRFQDFNELRVSEKFWKFKLLKSF